jgi:hypothetical protein
VFQTRVVHLNEVCEYILCANVFNNGSFLRNLIKFNLNNDNKKSSRGSSVSTVSNYGRTGVRSPTEAEDISPSLCVQTGSGDHPASCPMRTGGPFPGGKERLGRDADHSPPSSAEVKNE